jgi:hypothetical protein
MDASSCPGVTGSRHLRQENLDVPHCPILPVHSKRAVWLEIMMQTIANSVPMEGFYDALSGW